MKMTLGPLAAIMLALGMSCSFAEVKAQRVGVKTNVLYWAGLSPNLGLEVRLSRCFTLNMEGDFSVSSISGYKLDHVNFSPELRYWFTGRPQTRHFVGAMGLVSAYSLQFDRTAHKGQGVGVGLTYGYAFVLGRRWSLEATAGAGVFRYAEKKYDVVTSPVPWGVNHKGIALVPLKLGLSFTYLLK